LVRGLVLGDGASQARDAYIQDRRRPNRQAAPATPRAAATSSGRRHLFGAAQPLQGQEPVGDRHQAHVMVPARPGAAFEVVQAERALQLAIVLLDGLITNGKFCCVRHVRMDLTWWHQPLRLRRSALHTDAALPGASHDPDLDRLPPAQPASRRRPPLGSGLPAAGALGRTRRPALAGADRRGGA
jgi:hypothetical protein